MVLPTFAKRFRPESFLDDEKPRSIGRENYEEIFDRVVDQCGKAGLIKLEQVMVDGSSIRANASIYAMKESEENEERKDDDGPKPPGKIHSKDGLSNNDFRKRAIL